MGSYPISPVIQGLTSAMSIADLLHRQRIEDQQVELSRRRVSDEEEVNRGIADRANTDLSMRLSAMGARQMTPSDELEANTGVRVNFARRQVAGADGLPQQDAGLLPSYAPSDLKSRLVKAGGGQWVLPSEEDRASRLDRDAERQTKYEVGRTKATTQAKIDTEIAGTQTKLDKFGIPLKDEFADLLGLPHGTKILEEHLDDYTRSIASMKAANLQEGNDVRSAVPMYGTRGTGVAVIKKDGTVTWNPIDIGDKFTKPSEETPNQKRLAEADVLKKLVEEKASGYATQFDSAEDAIAAAKKDSATDPFVKRNYLSIVDTIRKGAPKPKTLNQMTPEEALQAIEGATGGSTPKTGAAGGGATKKSKGKADGNKIRAYAQRYSISFADAVQQAKKEGYDVSGLEAR